MSATLVHLNSETQRFLQRYSNLSGIPQAQIIRNAITYYVPKMRELNPEIFAYLSPPTCCESEDLCPSTLKRGRPFKNWQPPLHFHKEVLKALNERLSKPFKDAEKSDFRWKLEEWIETSSEVFEHMRRHKNLWVTPTKLKKWMKYPLDRAHHKIFLMSEGFPTRKNGSSIEFKLVGCEPTCLKKPLMAHVSTPVIKA